MTDRELDEYDEAAATHIQSLPNGILSYSCPSAEPWATLMRCLYTVYGRNIEPARVVLAQAMRGAGRTIGECFTIVQSHGLSHEGMCPPPAASRGALDIARQIDELRVRDLEAVARACRDRATMSFQGTFGMGHDSACRQIAEYVEKQLIAGLRATAGGTDGQ